MNINSFEQFLQNMVAAVQSSASALINFTIGAVMRAWLEACAQMATFLQSLIVYVASITRLSTSAGTDVDSFVADFGMTRLAAVAATGQVTFSRATPTAVAIVPVGAQVQTADGTQVYTVVADTTNPAYGNGSYTLAIGVASLAVLVQNAVPGTGGNVNAGTVTVLTAAIAGIDSVTNVSPFTNGVAAESDTALKTRFLAYIAGLRQATKAAIEAAIESLQQGLTYTIVENQTTEGVTSLGYFYVTVDDGTGYPSSTTLSNVSNAIDAVRAFTVTFGVFPPTVVTVNVVLVITSSGILANDEALVQTAIQNYIDTLPLGASLYLTRLSQVAYDASPTVLNVSGVTLNGGTSDIAASSQQVIKAGTVTVS